MEFRSYRVKSLVKSFRDLEVYQKTIQLSDEITNLPFLNKEQFEDDNKEIKSIAENNPQNNNQNPLNNQINNIKATSVGDNANESGSSPNAAIANKNIFQKRASQIKFSHLKIEVKNKNDLHFANY